MRRTATVAVMRTIARAHDDIRAIASDLTVPGSVRMRLHRVANDLLAVLLENQ